MFLQKKDLSVYIGILVAFITGALGLFFIVSNLTMNDAFWHIKTGEWVSRYGFIDQCYGSWSLAEDSWTAHEWLFGWMIYQVSRLGMDNVVRIFGVLYLITLGLCFGQSGAGRRDENPPMLYWEAVVMLQFCYYALSMTARPQYITAMFIAMYLLILNKSMQGKYGLLYFLPGIAVLWVNIHGGTALLSYLTILVYLLCNVMNWDIGKIHFQKAGKKWIIHCSIVLLLTVAAMMINPYGYEMLLYPYTNMQDKLMISVITEWAAPDAKNMVTLCMQILPMLLGVVALVQYQGRIKAHDVAVFFMYMILFLRSARFYPFLIVVQTCLIMPYAFRLTNPFVLKSKKEKKKKDMKLINNLVLLAAGGFCICYIAAAILLADYHDIERNKELPDELLAIISEDKPKRLCNYYDIGGYLIYHDIDVFVDGRYEPYKQKNIIEDYFTIMNPKDLKEYHQLEQLLEKYKFDAFLISTGNIELAAFLEEAPECYEMCYADEKWLYYRSVERWRKAK